MNLYLSDRAAKSDIALHAVPKSEYPNWLKKQPAAHRLWLEQSGLKGTEGKIRLMPSAKGGVESVVAILEEPLDMWSLAHLPSVLPKGRYRLVADSFKGKQKQKSLQQMALGWALATYRFTELKTTKEPDFPTLVLPKEITFSDVEIWAETTFLVRSLINLPANILTPLELARRAELVANKHKAQYKLIADKDLLKQNYPTIYTVGMGSSNRPCLVDIRWGKKSHPKITLVGKGVCFDSGGLDLKPSGNMRLMKKDMGGAAVVLGLANLIMHFNLPIQLRVLIPAVENSVSGDAMRPLDVVKTRKGLTVEIGNTDAEGRLILCDAMAEADSESPELMIDCATLTGAARVALGTDMPAFFTDDEKLAKSIYDASVAFCDPLWRLPLYKPYEKELKSDVADITNDPPGQGGAITAALFLKRFVEKTPSWVHLDMMAWNNSSRPGRPMGGEAMGLRALYHVIEEWVA